MLNIAIEQNDSGMIFATSEDGPGVFVAVRNWDELWPALKIAVEAWNDLQN